MISIFGSFSLQSTLDESFRRYRDMVQLGKDELIELIDRVSDLGYTVIEVYRATQNDNVLVSKFGASNSAGDTVLVDIEFDIESEKCNGHEPFAPEREVEWVERRLVVRSVQEMEW